MKKKASDKKQLVTESRAYLVKFSYTHSLDELLEETLNEAEKLTDSLIGFYHFVDEDQKSLTLQNWSTRTKSKFCKAERKGKHYSIDEAGVWVDCIHQQKPVIHNDYAALSHRKGLPENHAKVIRELVVPVFRNEKIAAILGVGNKSTDYTQNDINTVSALADLVWDIVERKRSEEALQISRDYSQNLINSSLDMIIAVNNKRKITEFNRAAEETFGYSRDEIIGKHVNILYANPREGLRVHKQTVLNGRHVKEIRNRRKNGEIFPTLLSASVILDTNGNQIGVMGVSRDITEKKKKENQIVNQTALLEAINKVFLEALTCETEEELGKSCLSIAENLTKSKFGLLGEVNPAGLFDTIAISNPGWDVCEMAVNDARENLKSMPIRGIDRSTIRDGESRIVNEVEFATHPDRIGTPEGHPKLTSFLGVPLKYEGKTIGMIGLGNKKGGYEIADQEMVENLSVAIVEVLKDKRAEKEKKHYFYRVKGINEATHVLTKSLDSQFIIDRCINIAKDMFEASEVTLFTLEEEEEYLKPLASKGRYKDEIMNFRLKIGEGLTGKVVQENKAKIINRIDLTKIGKLVPGTPLEPESLMCAPLRIKNDVIGAITLSKLGEDQFLENDSGFLENLADLSAIAIQNAKLYEESKKAEELKTLFLANMSHEIRTPLNSIVGFSQLLEERVCDKIEPEEKHFFDIIRSSNERLLKTVHGVLDVSRLESMSFERNPEALNLIEILEGITPNYYFPASEKRLEIKFSFEVKNPFIKADKYCIQQAISNLLDNAIKYTDEGDVSVSLKENKDHLILKISDTGIGMSKEYQKHIFELFSQESVGYTKKYQGVGLGLALTKRYLDLNEIPIEVESKKGVGTTFTLQFKKILKPQLEVDFKETHVSESISAVKRGCILIVEDDQKPQNLFKYFLKSQYELCYAISVVGAKRQLKEHDVDLILLDLSLVGNEDGLDLARFMRQSKQWKSLPIIAVTAHAFTSDRDNVINAGCNDYMAKPIMKDQLLKKIEHYLD